MSRFDRSEAQPARAQKINGQELDGTFCCQTCNVQCDTATLYPTSDLVWKCPEGHVSVIENFGDSRG